VSAIRAEPDTERQFRLLRQLIDLLPDEEILAMTEQLLSAEDLAEQKRFPALWRNYQEAIAQGERVRAPTSLRCWPLVSIYAADPSMGNTFRLTLITV
jgi:hypothetical protein